MPEERRLVTLLFADVTGSTAPGETLDPEDTRALLARALLTGDDAELNAGLSVLERLGDVAQIHRLEHLRRGSR